MAGATAGAGDFTGRQKQKLAEKHAQEQQQRATEVALATAAEDRKKQAEIVDYTQPADTPPPEDTGPVDYTVTPDDESDPTIESIVASTKQQVEPADVEERVAPEQERPVQERPVEVARPSQRIRARFDLNKVTVGRGTFYDFEAGRKYIVPPHVAQHLAERELVDVLD